MKSSSVKHNSLLNSDFLGLIPEEFSSVESCKGPGHNPSSLRLSALQRHLIGEGSHRLLVSSMKFDLHSDTIPEQLSSQACKVVMIERLPSGVFADPFELRNLVRSGVFVDASVFGDTNLELPSALSDQSVVKIHMDANHELLTGHENVLEISIELPLHARYPPLDGKWQWLFKSQDWYSPLVHVLQTRKITKWGLLVDIACLGCRIDK